MDYPLHYTEPSLQDNHHHHHHQQHHHHHQSLSNNTNNTSNNNTGTPTNNYRSFGVFHDSSIMFDNNSSASPTIDSLEVNNDDRSRSMLLLSTRPLPQVMHDPWNQHQLINNNTSDFNPNDIHNLHHHHNMSHSERGIAGFVSKLYQCLQSTDTSQKYARWCQHDGKDMFIIDCIPEFTEVVLPRLFKHCKFPSFVRQLNIYGFQRDTDARKSKDTKDKESCRWYHPCFRPGRRDLFHLIRRKATRYSRKKRVKTEEDPETILNLGSGDESEVDADNVVLLTNNHEERRCSSSASSVNIQPTTTAIDYYNNNLTSTSQLQLGYGENTTTTTTTTTNSPNYHHPIIPLPAVVESNNNTEYHHNNSTTPNISSAVVQEESDNADTNVGGGGLSTVSMHHHQQQQEVVMCEQELQSQIYHMKRHYERMLNSAQIQIDEQQVRIQQLEGALRLTKQSGGGYMGTVCSTMPNTSAGTSSSFNNNYVHSTTTPTRLVTHQRSLYELNTPRPTTTSSEYNDLLPPSNSTSTNSSSWVPFTQPQHHHHRDTIDNKTTNGIVAAGSNTTENATIIETDKLNISSSTTTVHNNRNNNKAGLPNHMNFNSYM